MIDLAALGRIVADADRASTPDQGWRRQYRFDIDRSAIAQCMTLSSAQILLELAVGSGNGHDLAEEFARTHPDDAMRHTAWAAIDGLLDPDAQRHHRVAGTASSSPLIRHSSERALRTLHYG